MTTLHYLQKPSSSFLYKVPEMSELCRNLFLEQPYLIAVLGNGSYSLIFKARNFGKLLSVAATSLFNDGEWCEYEMLTQIAGPEVATSHPFRSIMLPCVHVRALSLVVRPQHC